MQKYLYNKLIKNLNDAPFQAGCVLLEDLSMGLEACQDGKRDIGYELSGYDYERYCSIFEDVLSGDIVALEDSSYLGLLEAKKFYKKECKITPLREVLNENSEIIKSKIIHKFDKFNVGVYLGTNVDKNKQESLFSLLNLIGAKPVKFDSSDEPDGYSLLDVNKTMAYKMAGNVIFDAFDRGCDFLIVDDIRSFHIFDTYQKQIQKSVKRPLGKDGMAILGISQVLLMALGKVSTEESFTSSHIVKPTFI